MNIRSLKPDELDAFVQLTQSPDEAAMLHLTLQSLLAEGKSRPEWLFVADDHGAPAGRIGFFEQIPGSGEATMMALHLDWDGDYLGVGLPLLMAGFDGLRQAGLQRLERRVFAFWEDAPQQRDLFSWTGMALLQEKTAFSWMQSEQPAFASDDRLKYESFRSVGVEAFIEHVQATQVDVLDRSYRRELSKLGPARSAHDLVELLLTFSHNHEWWQVAFTPDDEPVGVIAPVLLAPEEGSVGYLGIVPGQRGNGYGQDLLNHGASVLQAHGISEIYCDVDIENTPMVQIFELSPFKLEADGHVWLFEKDLR
jgi:predicted acetyltransferase